MTLLLLIEERIVEHSATVISDWTLPEIPATMCSYLRWLKRLNFPIFLGESEAATAVGAGADGCFIGVDMFDWIL